MITPEQNTTDGNEAQWKRWAAVWNGCQLLFVSRDQCESMKHSYAGVLESVENTSDFLDALKRLAGQRFDTIGVASSTLTSFLIASREAADQVRRICANRCYVVDDSSDPSATSLRKLLHSVGFYEIAELNTESMSESNSDTTTDLETDTTTDLNAGISASFDHSSVSGLPDGQFEMQSSQPAFDAPTRPRVLVANRCALTQTEPCSWTLFGNPLLLKENGRITSSDNEEIGLATRQIESSACSTDSRFVITADVSWEKFGTEGAFAGVVGCYKGPGDTGMYVAMVDAYTQFFAQISIWRCDENWMRLAYTHYPLDQNASMHSLAISLAIAPTSVEVSINGTAVLWAYDTSLPRLNCFGIRIRGNQFAISQLNALNTPR